MGTRADRRFQHNYDPFEGDDTPVDTSAVEVFKLREREFSHLLLKNRSPHHDGYFAEFEYASPESGAAYRARVASGFSPSGIFHFSGLAVMEADGITTMISRQAFTAGNRSFDEPEAVFSYRLRGLTGTLQFQNPRNGDILGAIERNIDHLTFFNDAEVLADAKARAAVLARPIRAFGRSKFTV